MKAAQEYKEKYENERVEFERREKKLRSDNEELKKIHNKDITYIRQNERASYKQKYEDAKKQFDNFITQREHIFERRLKRQADEKDQKIKLLIDREDEFRKQAEETANTSVRNVIAQKDEQIRRFKKKVEALEKPLITTQSELKGEAGERALLDDLQKAFGEEGDLFSKQTRGVSQGDIIHQIRMPSGALVETPIVYDNKENTSITKKDRDKAKYYRENHNTDHLIIVLDHLPKEFKNGCMGRKDGILLICRDTIIEVAKEIRRSLIDISKISASKQYQATKQSKLYEYIGSRGFCRQMELICESDTEESKLQKEEEKDHHVLWKKRKAIQDKRRSAYISISSSVDAIIQEQPQSEDYIGQEQKRYQ